MICVGAKDQTILTERYIPIAVKHYLRAKQFSLTFQNIGHTWSCCQFFSRNFRLFLNEYMMNRCKHLDKTVDQSKGKNQQWNNTKFCWLIFLLKIANEIRFIFEINTVRFYSEKLWHFEINSLDGIVDTPFVFVYCRLL